MNNFKYIFIFILLFCGNNFVFAQFEHGRFIVPAQVINGDTVPLITLPTVEVFATLNESDLQRLRDYIRLRNKVVKVWPYVQFATYKFKEINDRALAMTPRERR